MTPPDGFLPRLPDAWSLTEEVHESITLETSRLSVQLDGFEALHISGKKAIGSAAGLCSSRSNSSPRAWFELIERIAILEREPPPLKDEVQLSNRPSLSNGVAYGRTRTAAQISAWLERVERHAILSSWRSGTPPLEVSMKDALTLPLTRQLRDTHEWTVLSFPVGTTPQVFVTGLVGLPRSKASPPILGWGASLESREESLLKAQNEALQMAGFLWDSWRELVSSPPISPPGPEMHLNHFLTSAGMESLHNWIHGRRNHPFCRSEKDVNEPGFQLEKATFSDLTPNWLKDNGAVIRCDDSKMLPLIFGPLPHLPECPFHPIF